MGLFQRSRRRPAHPPAGVELTEELRAVLPPWFEAAGEALAAGSDSIEAAIWVAGRALAEGGVSLGESLDGLRSTTRLVRQRDPLYRETHAMCVAWSEATLGYLHGLSCADPLTGLASLAHVRERISELYRDAAADGGAYRDHALVVTEAALPDPVVDPLGAARRIALLGRTARTVFSGPETIGKAGPARVVVLAPRNDVLAPRVSLLRRMVADSADRVWIEGLPGTDESAATLLDELARGA